MWYCLMVHHAHYIPGMYPLCVFYRWLQSRWRSTHHLHRCAGVLSRQGSCMSKQPIVLFTSTQVSRQDQIASYEGATSPRLVPCSTYLLSITNVTMTGVARCCCVMHADTASCIAGIAFCLMSNAVMLSPPQSTYKHVLQASRPASGAGGSGIGAIPR